MSITSMPRRRTLRFVFLRGGVVRRIYCRRQVEAMCQCPEASDGRILDVSRREACGEAGEEEPVRCPSSLRTALGHAMLARLAGNPMLDDWDRAHGNDVAKRTLRK